MTVLYFTIYCYACSTWLSSGLEDRGPFIVAVLVQIVTDLSLTDLLIPRSVVSKMIQPIGRISGQLADHFFRPSFYIAYGRNSSSTKRSCLELGQVRDAGFGFGYPETGFTPIGPI